MVSTKTSLLYKELKRKTKTRSQGGTRLVNSALIAMLNSQTLNQIAAANEAVVEKQFNKLRYSVRRLDRNANSPRPDFLISNRAGRPEKVYEVKTVHSPGYLPDRDAHISMLDEKLC